MHVGSLREKVTVLSNFSISGPNFIAGYLSTLARSYDIRISIVADYVLSKAPRLCAKEFPRRYHCKAFVV